ncbi:hypothetical protein QFC19_003941 [Naganishia cerealis]|uniref:Uncharacterized protein n=1 Tax=Naganishia cerealis TaxID=610337 RepID=A0ACC2VZ79_9TREE|nr:hypothetical protein QFC19_003941 [Naganishia cerealis]
MSNEPPSYQQAVSTSGAGLAPTINVSSAPSQGPSQASTSAPNHSHGSNHNEFEDDSSDDGMDSDGMLHPSKDDIEARKSMDDEYRELPEGWVRCFDKNTNHHFYVDTRTERSTWLHPYDDPVYLESLPDTHPANPNSEEARSARAKHEEISRAAKQKQASSSSSGRQDVHSAAQAAMAGGSSSQARDDRSMGGKLKDKLLGSTKEERKKAKLEQQERDRKAAEEYLARRKALMEQQANDPQLRMYSASFTLPGLGRTDNSSTICVRRAGGYYSNPYRYSAPMDPYRSRYDVMYSRPLGYGYRPGYGGYYGGGYGVGMGGLGMGLGGGAMLGLGTGALMGAALF